MNAKRSYLLWLLSSVACLHATGAAAQTTNPCTTYHALQATVASDLKALRAINAIVTSDTGKAKTAAIKAAPADKATAKAAAAATAAQKAAATRDAIKASRDAAQPALDAAVAKALAAKQAALQAEFAAFKAPSASDWAALNSQYGATAGKVNDISTGTGPEDTGAGSICYGASSNDPGDPANTGTCQISPDQQAIATAQQTCQNNLSCPALVAANAQLIADSTSLVQLQARMNSELASQIQQETQAMQAYLAATQSLNAAQAAASPGYAKQLALTNTAYSLQAVAAPLQIQKNVDENNLTSIGTTLVYDNSVYSLAQITCNNVQTCPEEAAALAQLNADTTTQATLQSTLAADTAKYQQAAVRWTTALAKIKPVKGTYASVADAAAKTLDAAVTTANAAAAKVSAAAKALDAANTAAQNKLAKELPIRAKARTTYDNDLAAEQDAQASCYAAGGHIKKLPGKK
jgi:hypothetical protein